MSVVGSELGTIIFGLMVLYVVALGFGMIIARQHGVAYVNTIARKVVAWPVEMLGKALVALAGIIRG